MAGSMAVLLACPFTLQYLCSPENRCMRLSLFLGGHFLTVAINVALQKLKETLLHGGQFCTTSEHSQPNNDSAVKLMTSENSKSIAEAHEAP